MPTVAYRYTVELGAAALGYHYSWTAQGGDPATYGPVDGLSITQKLADSPLWPAQWEPAECSFQLIVASMADIAGVGIGTPVAVDIRRTPGFATAGPDVFVGRVADLQAAPHALGMLVTVNCLDYTADLRGLNVGSEPWPAEGVYDRLNRVMAAVGLPAFDSAARNFGSGTVPANNPQVAAVDVDAQDAYELVTRYLSMWAMDWPGSTVRTERGYALGHIGPYNIGPDGTPLSWAVVPVWERPSYTGPLRLVLSGGVYAATPVPNPALSTLKLLDPAQLDWGSTYALTKDDVPNRVQVTSSAWDGSVAVTVGAAPWITATVDTELTNQADATALASMYAPQTVPVSRWVADEFLWHLEYAPAGAAPFYGAGLGSVVTVGPLDAAQAPSQREWFTGQLAAYTFTLADRRPTYTITLRRPEFDASASDPATNVLRWDDIPAGATWNTMSARDTWDDFRLVRGGSS